MSRYAAILLAAGRGTRYAAAGGVDVTKLVAPHRGEALVRHAARAVLASAARPALLVTGHARAAVEAAVADLPLQPVHNPDFADGLASSLRCGLAAVPAEADGVLVVLADMPGITAGVLDALIVRAQATPAFDAVVPVHAGRRGNPVLFSRRMFGPLSGLSGDRGARSLLEDSRLVIECVEQPATVFDDVDRPADLMRLA